ncbi:hypothetical protein A8990_13670 [Paenibacillus taihuensis]|uniref:Uncharacterized protein n=1 Tax=Paenibacillus taihuensis TaxID=1156355 RepID=A0A3D9R2T6_9BACL|nr:hypothetical protein [Paenibacillus taihuensis]REE68804.1 hypothetical protein A8990_13670 [Paenibacillus taihuensis]
MKLLEELVSRNDLFLIACLIVTYIFAWKKPRPFPLSIIILMMLFSLDLAKGLDNTIGLEPFSFYNTNVSPKFDVADALTWLLYPMVGYMFTYYFSRFRIHGTMIMIYILVCSCLAIVFEVICVYFDVFTYLKWKLYYSFCVYLTVQTMYVLMFTNLKRHLVKVKLDEKRRRMQV